jgi:hypothetical protein
MIFERRLPEIHSDPDEDNRVEEIITFINPSVNEVKETLDEGEGEGKGMMMKNGDVIIWPNAIGINAEHLGAVSELGYDDDDVQFTFYFFDNGETYKHTNWEHFDPSLNRHLPNTGMIIKSSISSAPGWGTFMKASDKWNPVRMKKLIDLLPMTQWIILPKWVINANTMEKVMRTETLGPLGIILGATE